MPSFTCFSDLFAKVAYSFLLIVSIEYCHILALPQPTYRFDDTPNAPPGFLSGAAYFLDHPEFDGPVGEVRNVYGKKAAKQECTRAVAGVLSDMLAEERGLK